MEPTKTRPANPLKYAWPLPIFLLSTLALVVVVKTISSPNLYQCLFPLSLVLQFSAFAGLALSLKFLGKQRNHVPRWIFACNAILGFGILPLIIVAACILCLSDH